MVRVFDAVGHGGGHIPELSQRGDQWLTATRRILHRSKAHDEICRTACIVCILSSVSQADARNGMLDRQAALLVLDSAGTRRRCVAEPAAKPTGPSQGAMIEEMRRRGAAARAR